MKTPQQILDEVETYHTEKQYIQAADTLIDSVLQLLEDDNYTKISDLLDLVIIQIDKIDPELSNADRAARMLTLISVTRHYSKQIPSYTSFVEFQAVKNILTNLHVTKKAKKAS